MSLELVNTLATLGSFLVIAATAIAALVQLRHARSSNLIEALAAMRQELASSEMTPALTFVRFDLRNLIVLAQTGKQRTPMEATPPAYDASR